MAFNIVGGPQPGQMQMGTTALPRSLNSIPTTPANPAGGETTAGSSSLNKGYADSWAVGPFGGAAKPPAAAAPESPIGNRPENGPRPMMQLGGVPGANPTANYRSFNQDGGAGSMGHHWGEAE